MRQDVVRLMEALPVFRAFETPELELLGVAFRARTFDAGSTICQQGAPGATFWVVVSGSVDLFREQGNAPRAHVASQGAGTLLGEVSIIDGGGHLHTAIAATEVLALEMDRGSFERLYESRSLFAYKLMDLLLQDLSLRLRRANDQLRKIDGGKVQSVAAMLRAIDAANRTVTHATNLETLSN